MTEKILVTRFEIHYTQFMNEKGELTQPLPPELDQNIDLWLKLYEALILTRTFDEKAINLQRTGLMGTYPSCRGQEAIAVGFGVAMNADDIFVPYYREFGAHLHRGVKMEELFQTWGGDERGNNFSDAPHDFSQCVPIATQCLHAAGIAAAMKYRQEKRAVLVAIGDGGTSEGNFYEAVNVAGAWHLPLVFMVNNNRWAISVPVSLQTSCQTFAQKAIAGGITSEQIDGNDIFAVYHATQKSMDRARQGKGAHLIEALTYRLCDHTTADDAKRYQPADEVEKAKHLDPVIRMKLFIEKNAGWTAEKEAALKQRCAADVEAAAQRYIAMPPAPNTDIFDYMYETLPVALQEQRDELVAYYGV